MAAKAMLGGLLSGVGQGMVDQAEIRRQEALERAREMRRQIEREEDRNWQKQRDESEREFHLGRDEANRKFQLEREEAAARRQVERDEAEYRRRRGLLDRVDVDAETGEAIGITPSGEIKRLGYKSGGIGPASRRGAGGGAGEGEAGIFAMLDASEKRTYDEIKARYTNPNTNQVDWTGLIGHLRSLPQERGGARWNEIADLLTGSVGTQMTEAEARAQAQREARARRGVFSSRESEFPETEGDEEAWIEQRAAELRGGQQQTRQQAPAAQSQGAAGQFKSPDDVKAAYQSGKISREQALSILRSQFGFQ